MKETKILMLIWGLIMSTATSGFLVLPTVLGFQGDGEQEREKSPKEILIAETRKSVNELVEDLLKRGDTGAIPALKEAFEKSAKKSERQRIASTLLVSGERDELFLDYLMHFARLAIESDMPFPFGFDSEGKIIPRKYSSEFLSWCKQNNIEPDVAAREALNILPVDVVFLAMARDPRAFDLLEKGLESKNYYIVARSAQGLARLEDSRAIKPIIEATRRLPSELAPLTAQALLVFNDPEAQTVAEEFIKDPGVLDSLRTQLREKGPKAIFGF